MLVLQAGTTMSGFSLYRFRELTSSTIGLLSKYGPVGLGAGCLSLCPALLLPGFSYFSFVTV